MSIKPILFSTTMVQAILAGRKTMTRRIAKELDGVDLMACRFVDGDIQEHKGYPIGHVSVTERAKYQTGDILWVRETWQEVFETEYNHTDPNNPIPIRALISNWDVIPKTNAGLSRACSCARMAPREKYYVYKETPPICKNKEYGELAWRPSIHMPKAAARIFLRVTNVRVERVQDISAEDAEAEGALQPGVIRFNALIHNVCGTIPQTNFMILWNSLNSKNGYGWDANPWVWVYTFERCEKPEGWCEA